MKVTVILLAVALIALGAFFDITYINQNNQLKTLQDNLNSVQNDLNNAKTNLAGAENTLSTTQAELSRTKSDLAQAGSALSASQAANTTIQNELNSTKSQLQSYQSTFGQVIIKSGIQPNYTLSNLQPMNLVRNPGAKDPTWSQVVSFIRQDKTDSELYVEGVHMCGEFAQEVYNNAEIAGLRTALVVVKFTDGGSAHALDAFKTTDRGLVFIDCTGPKSTVPPGSQPYTTYDKIAYVAQANKLGLLELLRDDESTSYSFYSDMESKISSYEAKLKQYYLDTAGHSYYVGTLGATIIQQRWNDLETLRLQLIPDFQLDGTTGIVSGIEIYW